MPNELPIPDEAKRDIRAVEMVRGWIAEGDLFIVLNVGFWEQPERGIDEREAWGLFMSDMARHIANAHNEKYASDVSGSLKIIRDAFVREIEKPTSSHSGKFATEGD